MLSDHADEILQRLCITAPLGSPRVVNTTTARGRKWSSLQSRASAVEGMERQQGYDICLAEVSVDFHPKMNNLHTFSALLSAVAATQKAFCEADNLLLFMFSSSSFGAFAAAGLDKDINARLKDREEALLQPSFVVVETFSTKGTKKT